MSKRPNNRNKAKGAKKGPLRVVLRCAWSGTRLSVPSSEEDGGPLTLSTTLHDIASRLRPNLPAAAFETNGGATLVCLRKMVPTARWETTTMREMLDGDDGSAGVILTLDIGSGGGSAPAPPAMAVTTAVAAAGGGGGGSGKVSRADPISAAARSLNIKTAEAPRAPPPEPMDVSSDDAPAVSTPEVAWANVLRSNFDAAVKDCLLTLLKIIDNLLSKPGNTKVRSIRCANAAFDRKVGRVVGAFEFLHSFGFTPTYPIGSGAGARPETMTMHPENESRERLIRVRNVLLSSAVGELGVGEGELPAAPKVPPPASVASPQPSGGATGGTTSSSTTGVFSVYKAHSHNLQSAAAGAPNPYAEASSVSVTERQLQQLEAKKNRMEREMQSNFEMDRGMVAYLPGSGPDTSGNNGNVSAVASAEMGTESRGDSSLVAARMKRMDEEKKKREAGFTTKVMRDLEKMKKAKVYSHAQIRISFADGTSLSAKFQPNERVSSVRSVIGSAFRPSMRDTLAFDLYVAPPRRILDDNKRLHEEGLVPAAKVFVSWKVGGSPPGGGVAGGYLMPELFGASSPSASAFPEAKNLVGGKKDASKAADGKGSGAAAKGKAPSKEEAMMKRMMGKSAGMFGKGGDSSKKEAGKGSGSGGKPKWFKG